MRFALLLFLVASVVAAQSVPPRKDIPAIAKAANGAIVSIIMSDKDGQPIAQGTGFVISKDGHIVTNYHVIQNGSSAIVKLPDGAFFVVDGVLAFDKARDVAVIKAHGENFRTLTLGNSDRLQVGEEVVAIGNPLSLESTVSNGIVSSVRTIDEEGGKYLQVTAPISPGSSGGPLFNMAGEVVGITTMYLKGGENLNFAIPINDAKRLLLAKSSKILDFPNEPEPKETHDAQATPSQHQTCSEEAERFVRYKRAEYGNDAPTVEYTSHYDATAGKCYVESTFYFVEGKTYPSGHRYGSSREINDASFEGSGGPIYGWFAFPSTDGSRWYGHTCTIHPPDRPEIICRTEEEFNDLALKYFGTTPTRPSPEAKTPEPSSAEFLHGQMSGQFTGGVVNTTANLRASAELAIQQSGNVLSGCFVVFRPLYGSGQVTGSVRGATFEFVANSPNFDIKFTGQKVGEDMNGTYVVTRGGTGVQNGTFAFSRSHTPLTDSLNASECPSD